MRRGRRRRRGRWGRSGRFRQRPWRGGRRCAWWRRWRDGLRRARRLRRWRRRCCLRRRGWRRRHRRGLGGRRRHWRWGGWYFNRRPLLSRRIKDNVKTLFFNLQGALAGCARVQFQKNDRGKQQMREHRGQNRAPTKARPLRAGLAHRAPAFCFSRARAGQFGFGTAHRWQKGPDKRNGDSVLGRVAEWAHSATSIPRAGLAQG